MTVWDFVFSLGCFYFNMTFIFFFIINSFLPLMKSFFIMTKRTSWQGVIYLYQQYLRVSSCISAGFKGNMLRCEDYSFLSWVEYSFLLITANVPETQTWFWILRERLKRPGTNKKVTTRQQDDETREGGGDTKPAAREKVTVQAVPPQWGNVSIQKSTQ